MSEIFTGAELERLRAQSRVRLEAKIEEYSYNPSDSSTSSPGVAVDAFHGIPSTVSYGATPLYLKRQPEPAATEHRGKHTPASHRIQRRTNVFIAPNYLAKWVP